MNPGRTVHLRHLETGDYGALDMRLMERVLDNLLNNALRYCQSTVQASLLLNGNQATLVVEDDGPGIAPDAREQVFEPFVRLDPSRDRATGGCGLGLAIVHSIALAMGGRSSVMKVNLAAPGLLSVGPSGITFPKSQLPDLFCSVVRRRRLCYKKVCCN